MDSSLQARDASQIDLNNMLHLINLLGAKSTEDLNMLSLPSSLQQETVASQKLHQIQSPEQKYDLSLNNIEQIGNILELPTYPPLFGEQELDMSIQSPCSSSSYPSPRTVHSNISTPTCFNSQSISRFEDQLFPKMLGTTTEEEKSFHFSNPFFQNIFDNQSPCQTSTRKLENEQQFSYFDRFSKSNELLLAPGKEDNKNKVLGSANSLSPIDEYFSHEQDFARNRIQDFDAFIATLTVQSKNERKRTQSKTFEDIPPYLSGKTTQNCFESIRPPFLHKRSKTQDGYEVEQSSLLFCHLNRKRQRSKTNATVYQMKNTPIIPFGSSFDLFKQNNQNTAKTIPTSLSQYPSSLEGVESTLCNFVQQAAKSALKKAKCTIDSEVSKRAIAGTKARDEQNREKSKRYYDRKKAQSSAMSGLCTAIDDWYHRLGQTSPYELQSDYFSKQSDAIANQSFILPSERQKALKELSKMKESSQIRAIMSCATKMEQILQSQPETVAKQLIISHGQHTSKPSAHNSIISDFDILESGLHIWLDFLHCWSDLILAEKRLKGKNEDRPIFQLITALTDLL